MLYTSTNFILLVYGLLLQQGKVFLIIYICRKKRFCCNMDLLLTALPNIEISEILDFL